ncbi:MAG: type II secretion system protein [Polaromonas sp.]
MQTGKPAQSGFTYLFVLMLIALIGMGLAAVGTLWHTESQRAREADLLFIGDQYRQAIRSYYELDPAQPRLPQSIDDLLEDARRPNIVRHLRRAYRDPFTGGKLALIRTPEGNGIVGVYSLAAGRPFKTKGFLAEYAPFSGADSYAKWRFVYMLPVASAQSPAPTNPTISPTDQSATPSNQPVVPTFRPAPRAGQKVVL